MIKEQTIKPIIAAKDAKSLHIAIVKTDYHETLIANLEKKAIETLTKQGVLSENIKIFTAPGSWELPLVAQFAAKTGMFDGIIALGIIVKGDTYHFEMIANECARGLMNVSLEHTIPVGFEVLAVYDEEQAIKRASDNEYNKGIEAANAVLKIIKEKRSH